MLVPPIGPAGGSADEQPDEVGRYTAATMSGIGLVEILFLVLSILVPLAWAIFWLYQFVQLMLLEDDLFPGPYDKLVWGAAFVILAPLAPFAFLMWKGARTAEGKGRRPPERS